jgi:thiol-disulfide isomerase/thioredoxin
VAPDGLIAVGVVAAASAGFGAVWRWRSGLMRSPGPPARAGATAAGGQPPQGTRVSEADIGVPLGERVTLLQFSSSFCAPCRATRALLADVAGAARGVSHVEVDVADRLDLVRRLSVRRTPTVLVLGPQGQVVRRASGQPRRADVLAAVAEAQALPAGRR